jgi:hypothetical protein
MMNRFITFTALSFVVLAGLVFVLLCCCGAVERTAKEVARVVRSSPS